MDSHDNQINSSIHNVNADIGRDSSFLLHVIVNMNRFVPRCYFAVDFSPNDLLVDFARMVSSLKYFYNNNEKKAEHLNRWKCVYTKWNSVGA